MPKRDFWRPKARTVAAMARLCRAKLLVTFLPFDRWRHGLGLDAGNRDPADVAVARKLGADVEWSARRLPFSTKCLPRAMALSSVLRRNRIDHAIVIAVRPSALRQSPDALHAWVEVGGERILGDLPGPWIEIARLGG